MSQNFKKVILDLVTDFVSFCVPYILVGIVLLYGDNGFTFEQRKVLVSAFGLVFLSSMSYSFEYRYRLKDLQKQDDKEISR